MNHTLSWTCRLGGVVALTLFLGVLSGCAYSITDLSQLAPSPTNVTVKQPPDIVDTDAEISIVDTQDYGYNDWICDWVWDWWCGCWVWDCWTIWVWTRTDVIYNTTIKLTVKDPSLDLNDNPAWVRVMDAKLPSSLPGQQGRGKVCLLNIDQTDIALKKTDITGTDINKTVRIQLKNKQTSLSPDCQVRAAEVLLRIIVNDHGVEVVSPTEGKVLLIIKS